MGGAEHGSAGPRSPARDDLAHRVSRSVFWNAVLLPVIALLNLVMASLVRRTFGLDAGVYDILLGVVNTVLLYSTLGIPTSLTKFLPERDETEGRRGVVAVLRWAVPARLLLALAFLVPLNLAARPLVEWIGLTGTGQLEVDTAVAYLRLASLLVLARAALELVVKTLHAFLMQLWVNLLTLAQAALEPALMVGALAVGFGIGGVFGALLGAAGALAVVGTVVVARQVARLPAAGAAADDVGAIADEAGAAAKEEPLARAPATTRAAVVEAGKFSLFTYVFELSLFFGSVNFARWALGVVYGDPHPVALFSAAFQVAMMVVVLVVSGFRGVYRPLFARLRARQDLGQLRRAFSAMSKVQVALLIPSGVGLAVMAGDYIPLLFSEAYLPAVPLTRILVALLFTETAFNLAIIILSVDERYRAVLGAQALLLLGTPLFVAAAYWGGLTGAAVTIGALRLVVTVVGYLVGRRAYGLRFPWGFAARVGAVGAAMGVVLVAARSVWATSVLEAATLTALGAAIFLVGLRWGRVLGSEEAALLRRASLPGSDLMLRLLAVDVDTGAPGDPWGAG